MTESATMLKRPRPVAIAAANEKVSFTHITSQYEGSRTAKATAMMTAAAKYAAKAVMNLRCSYGGTLGLGVGFCMARRIFSAGTPIVRHAEFPVDAMKGPRP